MAENKKPNDMNESEVLVDYDIYGRIIKYDLAKDDSAQVMAVFMSTERF